MVNLARRDPMSLADEFFNDFFRRTGYPLAVTRAAALPGVTRARMDVVDKGDRYEVVVDLPGVKKEDIHVTVEGARVAIAADARRDNEVKNGERVLRSERFAASYARSFELPAEVSEAGADAAFVDGVLTLTLPKRAAAGKRLTIK